MIRVPHPMNGGGDKKPMLELNPLGIGNWRLTIIDRGRSRGSLVLEESDMAKIAFHVYNQIGWNDAVSDSTSA